MADQGTEGLLSPFLRKLRIRAAAPYIYGRVLDVGCGSGELASIVTEENYCGFDIDGESIALAVKKYPTHDFVNTEPPKNQSFDTIVSLAVIEHVSDPVDFLSHWSRYLKNSNGCKFVLTTPHPSIETIHTIGAKCGLFSKHGSEEHEELIDYERMQKISKKAGLKIIVFKKFLLGMNQLFVLSIR
ncbi:MAG: class I SAM-dependent methyltransferase [Bacteroidota bacterium]